MTTSDRSSLRRAVSTLGVAALLGLTTSFGGTVHAHDRCWRAWPGASDYCSSSECGPCGAGEGDCDEGQCAPGLECVEEGSVDRCRAVECAASPDDSDYCSSAECGACAEGEGDCDPGQCGEGLECVEEGSVDRCRPVARPCALAVPDAADYCAADLCGVCLRGEGDCEPGQCGGGLTCVDEGVVDRCRPVGERRLQVQLGGAWTNVCCVEGRPVASGGDCAWTEAERVLTDRTAGRELDCPERDLGACECDGTGERLHGHNGGPVTASLDDPTGGPVYGNYEMETCVTVDPTGLLVTQPTSPSCPLFQLE